MKKLIVMIAVTGLLAVGCSSQGSRGGTNENSPTYGTGTTENSAESNPKGAEQLKNNRGSTTNAPTSNPTDNGTGGATTPGGSSSGNDSTQTPNSSTTPTPENGNNNPNSSSSGPGSSGTQNP